MTSSTTSTNALCSSEDMCEAMNSVNVESGISMVANNTKLQVGQVEINRDQIDHRRYRKAMRFFRRAALQILLWEVVLRKMLGEAFVGRQRDERMRRIARQFRGLAIEMGGVMIKLGQFMSVRVDVMPDSLIEELAGLQDEVPAEDNAVMMEVLGSELGRPIDEVFSAIGPDPQAAASLGQVYRGRLANGDRVAVKIQRPFIERMVMTDLGALRIVAGWMMRWKMIRKHADVPALLDEFALTLWEELDYIAEAKNAQRFYDLYSDDVKIYIPQVYHEYTTKRLLVMEDVTSIKITNTEALHAAGIDSGVAAQRVVDTYLQMIFEFGFFHADPHPGNLFVYPLPDEAAHSMYNGRRIPHEGRPFYLIFVDFGMCGHVPEGSRSGLREAVIAMGMRDARRLVRAIQELGLLLPTEHMAELEAAAEDALSIVWGKTPKELASFSNDEMMRLAHKYRSLLFTLPFQIPQDFIYMGRAVGMLSGLCTALDPTFDPWQSVSESARKLLTREMIGGRSGEVLSTTLKLVGEALRRLGSNPA